MTKLEKIEQKMQKIREKITQYQSRLKELDEQRTEQENLQIVQAVRALQLTRDELAAFLLMGKLPPQEAAAVPHELYSHKKMHKEPTTESEDKPNEE